MRIYVDMSSRLGHAIQLQQQFEALGYESYGSAYSLWNAASKSESPAVIISLQGDPKEHPTAIVAQVVTACLFDAKAAMAVDMSLQMWTVQTTHRREMPLQTSWDLEQAAKTIDALFHPPMPTPPSFPTQPASDDKQEVVRMGQEPDAEAEPQHTSWCTQSECTKLPAPKDPWLHRRTFRDSEGPVFEVTQVQEEEDEPRLTFLVDELTADEWPRLAALLVNAHKYVTAGGDPR